MRRLRSPLLRRARLKSLLKCKITKQGMPVSYEQN